MNRRARPFAAPVRAVLATLALGAGAAGCADIHRALETSRINPESPVAAQVAAGADRNYPYPFLRDVPPVPRNLPQPAAVKGEVQGLVVCRRAMEAWVIDHPPLSGQPAAFADDARQLAAISTADVAPPDSAALAEAFAAQLREEAAPPPAIGAGPAPTPADAAPPPAGAPSPVAKAHAGSSRPAAAAPAASAPPPVAAQAPTQVDTPVPAPSPAAAIGVDGAPPLPPPLPDPLLARCA